jgi:hypothetical protein
MKNTTLPSIVFWLLWILFGLICPSGLRGQDQKPQTNVNSRYEVEKVEISGVADSKISKALRDDMQKLVGEKYDQEAAQKLADRMRKELQDYSVTVKAKRGDTPDHVKVVFEAERTRWKRFEIPVPPVVYESKEGMNGVIEIPIDFQPHSVFTVGFVDSADELLERNAGVRLRLENRKIGTDLIQARVEFDTYHQTFNAATQAALAVNPGVPGIYRARQDFAPSLSLIPFRDLKLSIGASFERFQMQYPVAHTQTAYAGTADVQFRHNVRTQSRYRQRFSADYSLRSATHTLDSDFIYTRHFATVDYTVTKGRNLFGAHVQGGFITGIAPLFERFLLGDSLTLRGWNKFDVAPLGGTRSLHGSLEYRYRSFQLFYDAGTVYDPGKAGKVRHGLGFGWADKDGFFASVAFPVRLHQVVPMFMLGFRY